MSFSRSEEYQDAYIKELDARLAALENNEFFLPTPPKTSKSSARRPRKQNKDSAERDLKAVSAPTSARRNRVRRHNQFTQQDIQKFLNCAYEKKPLWNLEPEQYEQVLSILKQQKKDAVAKKRFVDSMESQEAIEYVNNHYKNAIKEEGEQEIDSEFQGKMDTYYESLKKFDDETKDLEEKFLIKKRKAKDLIVESQKDDLLDLQEYWSSPAKQRLYNRASNQLVNLRKRQIDEVNLNNLAEAARLQKHISRLEKEESRTNSEAWQLDYNQALDKLQQKHKRELETFEFQSNIQFTSLKQKRETLRQRFLYRKANLEHKKEQDKATSLFGASATKRIQRNISASTSLKKTEKILDRALDNVYKDISSIRLKPIVFKVPK